MEETTTRPKVSDEASPNRLQSGARSSAPQATKDPLPSLLLEVEPWDRLFLQQIRDLVRPPKLPPLQLTSRPIPVQDIWGLYRYNQVATRTSLLLHALLIAAIVIPFGHEVVQVVKKEVLYTPVEISPYEALLPPAAKKAGGGGGGGDRSPEPAPKANLPKPSMQQLTPPAVVLRNPEPKLPAEPTVIVPPEIPLPNVNIAQLGDPLGKISVPSNGPGFGGGIGTGSGGGVGSGRGGGVGPGEGGGIGGGIFRVGGGVSAPEVIFRVEPEYAEQARKAKFQGTVLLGAVVQRDGSVRDIKVVQSLGLGLDEKAVEAVRQWRFRPGLKNGQPVDVYVVFEVAFRLL